MQNIDLIKKFIKLEKYKDAEIAIKQFLLKDQNNYEYHLLLGYIYVRINKFEEAIKSYENAKNIDLNETVLNSLTNLYVRIKDYDKALIEISESLKINSNNPKTLNNYGCLLISKNKEKESIEYFQRSIEIDQNYMDPKYNLLEILEKTNNNKLLEETINNELIKFPHDSILKYYKAVFLNLNQKNDDAYDVLKKLNFEHHKQNWEYKRLNLIGHICNNQKKFKQAFENHNKANQFLIKNFCLDAFNENKYFNKLKDFSKFLKTNTKKSIQNSNDNNSLLFIIGFPRSGTTLLDTILSAHSLVEVIEEKPLIENTIKAINDESRISCNNIDFNKLQKKYLSYLSRYTDENPLSNKLIVDKMPLNLIYARLINKIFPNAKIIFCLRHPLDTILSCYFQNFVLNEAMINFLDLKRTAEMFDFSMEIFNSYNEIPSDKLMTVKYENIITNFDRELKSICNFIGIEKELSMNKFYETASKKERVRTASYNQVNKPIYLSSKFKWLNYKDELKPIIPIVKKWIGHYHY